MLLYFFFYWPGWRTRKKVSSMKEMDSINAHINQGISKTTDSVYNHLQEEQNNRNLDAFVRMQKEEQEKQKKAMWIRIGLGVFFLAILVFGVMRRKKAAK